MNDKMMDKINIVLYYVVAPILVLEFLLTDLGIITFTVPLFVVSAVVLLALIAVVYIYKRKHPDYEFKANDLYTKLLVVVILIECFYTAGFFNWDFGWRKIMCEYFLKSLIFDVCMHIIKIQIVNYLRESPCHIVGSFKLGRVPAT